MLKDKTKQPKFMVGKKKTAHALQASVSTESDVLFGEVTEQPIQDIPVFLPPEKKTGFWGKVGHGFGMIIKWLYIFRKVFLAIPVVYAALRLAAYNMVNLPETVGLNLQANGEFAMEIARSMAVMGPLALTGGCLVMMFLSRKSLYAWSISIFTLALPVLLLVSNLYPA